LNEKRRGGYVSMAASPYQPAQGVVPTSVSSNDKLNTIDSSGYKITYLFEGEKIKL
jgi:hypothetical protein